MLIKKIRGASLEEVSRLHDELTRGAPVQRLLADGGRRQVPGGRGAPGGELRDAPREARGPEAAPHSHERHRLAGADRERALRGGGAARQQEDR